MVGWSTGPPAVETAREGIQSRQLVSCFQYFNHGVMVFFYKQNNELKGVQG
jgi:hypothetical protein